MFANPKAFLGPKGDPAKIEGLQDAVLAMQQIQDGGYCYVINPHGEMEILQNGLLDMTNSVRRCVLNDVQDTQAALDTAFEKGAYTMWGLHPYIAEGNDNLQPIVIPDDRLLQNLSAWVVAGSDMEAEAGNLVNNLASEDAKIRITKFRFPGYKDIPPWRPTKSIK